MKVVARGRGGQRPMRNDCVRVRYVAWTRSGEVAGTSSDDPEGEVVCLRHMSPGVAEALAAMRVGEQRRLWIPEALAFPPNPKEAPPAHPNDLTYDLTLLQIIPAPATPTALKAPSARARRLPSGVAIEVLRQGSGGAHPGDDGQQMTLHMSGWTVDGTLFESTSMGGGHPADVGIGDLVPGLREGLRQMSVGQKARLWIPAGLAYGEKPRRGQPAGNLVYDIELIGLK